MKLRLRRTSAILIFALLALVSRAANSQTDIAPPAGIIRIDLPAHARVLASHPFLPFDPSVNDQLAEQLGVQGGSQDVQRILKWDDTAQAYVIAEKTLYKRYGRSEVELVDSDSDTGAPTTMTIQPGEGFWIENLGTNSHTLYLCGQVMLGGRYRDSP